MTRARQEFVPSIPQNVDDVVIEDTWSETWSGVDFLNFETDQFLFLAM
jgi:hypothetical protein